MRYSPLETSISAVISVTDENAATAGAAEGKITATVTFQDGWASTRRAWSSWWSHTITRTQRGQLHGRRQPEDRRIAGAEDILEFAGLTAKIFVLGTSPGVINVNIGDRHLMVLTGFEF